MILLNLIINILNINIMNLEIVNFEDFGLVELNAQELQEVEGGIIPLIIAFLIWPTLAY